MAHVKTTKVYKSTKLNNAKFPDFNLSEYQVFLQLITKIGKVDLSGNYIQGSNLKRDHILKAEEFANLFNLEINNAYRALKSACQKLVNSSIMLEQPELDETWQIPICSFAKYKKGVGEIHIEFNHRIMPYLAQVKKRFILYNLKEISNFKSLYTTRLYEYIQEFKDTGYIECSVEKLRDFFATGDKFKLYSDFKRFTFGHAVDEINKHYEMHVRFKEIKDGKQVVRIKFYFKPTQIRKVVNPHNGKEQNQYIKPKTIRKQSGDIIKSKDQ